MAIKNSDNTDNTAIRGAKLDPTASALNPASSVLPITENTENEERSPQESLFEPKLHDPTLYDPMLYEPNPDELTGLIGLRIEPDLKAAFKEYCQSQGISMSKWLRQVILLREINTPVPLQVNRATYSKLGEIYAQLVVLRTDLLQRDFMIPREDLDSLDSLLGELCVQLLGLQVQLNPGSVERAIAALKSETRPKTRP